MGRGRKGILTQSEKKQTVIIKKNLELLPQLLEIFQEKKLILTFTFQIRSNVQINWLI